MFTSEERQVPIKDIPLTNNCPVCFSNDGLILSFHQKLIKTPFLVKITDEISKTVACEKCGSPIYPVDWDNDMERVLSYYEKLVEPKKTSSRYTFFALISIVIGLLAVSGILLWLIYVN
ncbi:hypothetical protein [Leptobacterium sp. I13]|uniref:hypothetical protein n=1 Tax=Leptobacterium meishanense TaxID=3128904 RepID=UPI0030EDE0FB